MSKTTIIAISLIALPLAACGGGGSTDANGTATETAATSGGMPGNWKATDACSIVTKEAMAEILGSEVSEASVGLVNEPGAQTAATSECTYILKDGGRASVMTRWSPIADNTPGAIATARNATAESVKAFGKTVEDAPGVGKAAFFVPGINQLNVFFDEARFAVITVPGGADGKDKAIAVAKKAAGG